MQAWETILSAIGGSVVFTGSLGFLLREWISTRLRESIRHEYAVEQARVEAVLKAEFDSRLESLRAGYRRALDENLVRFTKLHEEQAGVVKRLYQLVAKAEDAILSQVSDVWTVLGGDGPSPDSVKHEVAETLTRLRVEFSENRIFLPDAICQRIQNLFGEAVLLSSMENTAEAFNETSPAEARREAYRRLVSDFGPLRTELEMLFRKILGVAQPGQPLSTQDGEGKL